MAILLIADGELAALVTADRGVTSGQHELLVAETGEQLLALAGSRRPHLVILPLGLPDLSGEACCRRLRTVLRLNGTHIVMTSREESSLALTRRCTAAGADRLLAAPVSRETFYGLVKTVVQARKENMRVALDVAVDLGEGRVARARNLSRTGMRLELDAPLLPGTTLRLRFQLPRMQNAVQLGATVIWSRQEPGQPATAGVRFERLGRFEQQVLDIFVMTAKTVVQL